MDKKVMINELIRLYDENAELKNRLNTYEVAKAANRGDLGAVDGLAPITVMCIDAGRKTLWNKVIDHYRLGRDYDGKYHYSRCNYPVFASSKNTEDGSGIIFLTYDQWIKTLDYGIFEDRHSYSSDKEREFYLDCIKQYSVNEILEFFSPELRDIFDSLVNDKKMALVREAKPDNE